MWNFSTLLLCLSSILPIVCWWEGICMIFGSLAVTVESRKSQPKTQRSHMKREKMKNINEALKGPASVVESIHFGFKWTHNRWFKWSFFLQTFVIMCKFNCESDCAVISETSRKNNGFSEKFASKVKSHFVNWSRLHSCSLLTVFGRKHTKKSGEIWCEVCWARVQALFSIHHEKFASVSGKKSSWHDDESKTKRYLNSSFVWDLEWNLHENNN